MISAGLVIFRSVYRHLKTEYKNACTVTANNYDEMHLNKMYVSKYRY